jgi:hypothetical protein
VLFTMLRNRLLGGGGVGVYVAQLGPVSLDGRVGPLSPLREPRELVRCDVEFLPGLLALVEEVQRFGSLGKDAQVRL